MIIIKANKHWQVNYSNPDTNFSNLDDNEVWVVEDKTELANKIISLKTHWEPVLDKNGNLIDVVDNDPEFDQRSEELANKRKEIAELKQMLFDTDYVVCKIFEGVATTSEYSEVLAKRQEARIRINELEEQLQ